MTRYPVLRCRSLRGSRCARTGRLPASCPPRACAPFRAFLRPFFLRPFFLRRFSLCPPALPLVAGLRHLAAAICIAAVVLTGPAGEPARAADVAVPVGVGVSNPTLSFGLSNVSDAGTGMPFLDLARVMRPLYGAPKAGGKKMKTADLSAAGVLDAEGWPTRIPAGMKSISTVWDWSSSNADPAAAASRAGVYVLTYEGTGTLDIGGAQGVRVLSSTPGRIVFENRDGGSMRFAITATDLKHDGDYIRDISVVAQKYEALHDAGAIFNPDFLALVEDARELRFMDWMKTNGSTQVEWADRPQVTDVTWAKSGGIPVEMMVALANETGTDPWFNMPAMASDDYVRQFATYVRDHLAPGLVAQVEYSNETWNWGMTQTHWLDDQAKALWGPKATNLDFAAMRATQTAVIWDDVFGSEADARVQNVLAAQTVNPGVATKQLNAKVWAANDPAGFVDPATVFDKLAITTYFGNSTVGHKDMRSDLIAHIKDFANGHGPDPVAWLAGKLMDPVYNSSIPQVEANWAANKVVADKYGLDLVAYEGGQHVHQSSGIKLTAEEDRVLTAFMTDFVRSPEMATLYDQLWDAWAQVSDGPFMQYGDVAQPNKWGSWGLFSAIGDDNPRADLLVANNAEGQAWFGDGGGARYLQGVVRLGGDGGGTLAGTGKGDTLIGGRGADVFLAAGGDDRINGGAGIDTLVLAGKASDYRFTADGKGHDIDGPDGHDFVLDVEQFRFDGNVTRTLAQMIEQTRLGAQP